MPGEVAAITEAKKRKLVNAIKYTVSEMKAEAAKNAENALRVQMVLPNELSPKNPLSGTTKKTINNILRVMSNDNPKVEHISKNEFHVSLGNTDKLQTTEARHYQRKYPPVYIKYKIEELHGFKELPMTAKMKKQEAVAQHTWAREATRYRKAFAGHRRDITPPVIEALHRRQDFVYESKEVWSKPKKVLDFDFGISEISEGKPVARYDEYFRKNPKTGKKEKITKLTWGISPSKPSKKKKETKVSVKRVEGQEYTSIKSISYAALKRRFNITDEELEGITSYSREDELQILEDELRAIEEGGEKRKRTHALERRKLHARKSYLKTPAGKKAWEAGREEREKEAIRALLGSRVSSGISERAAFEATRSTYEKFAPPKRYKRTWGLPRKYPAEFTKAPDKGYTMVPLSISQRAKPKMGFFIGRPTDAAVGSIFRGSAYNPQAAQRGMKTRWTMWGAMEFGSRTSATNYLPIYVPVYLTRIKSVKKMAKTLKQVNLSTQQYKSIKSQNFVIFMIAKSRVKRFMRFQKTVTVGRKKGYQPSTAKDARIEGSTAGWVPKQITTSSTFRYTLENAKLISPKPGLFGGQAPYYKAYINRRRVLKDRIKRIIEEPETIQVTRQIYGTRGIPIRTIYGSESL